MIENPYWRRQNPGAPLFPKLLWSRPEQRSAAGRLLIVGGNLHGFAAPAEAFVQAEKAEAGSVRVVLPDATKKLVGPILEHVEYAPSTPSGSFSQKALGELLGMATWADAVLVAGDLGRNSETAILLEKFAGKYTGQLTLTKDAVDYVTTAPQQVLARSETLLVLSLAQLQKLATKAGFARPFTFDMDLIRFVEALHEFTQQFPINIIVKHLDQVHSASGGKVISTNPKEELDIWRVKMAAHASVWWLQNPTKPLEALATASFELALPEQSSESKEIYS